MTDKEYKVGSTDEVERLREEMIMEGEGAGPKWEAISGAAMSGNEEARREVERILGHPVRTMQDQYRVMSAANDVMTQGELARSEAEAEQMLRAQADPARLADEYLANKMGALRRKAGLTQAQLAAETGIAITMLRKYENGQRSVLAARADTALKIAKALGVTVEELLSHDR